MSKFKLSKQTIFTLLGLLVIIGSIPIAVLLVKQRQEIRKEAAITNDNACKAIQGNCTEGSCQYGAKRTGLCAGGINRTCCAPNCGQWCQSQGYGGGGCECKSDEGATSYPCNGKTWQRTRGPVRTWDNATCTAYRPMGATPAPTKPPSTGGDGTDTGTGTGTVNIDGSTSTKAPVWGYYATGKTCSTPKATSTPTQPVKKITTPTNTPTPTPSKRTCNQTCTDDSWCQSPLKCLTRGTVKYCLNSSCPEETDCTCPGPTPTNTVTPTPTVTITPTPTLTSTPTPTPTTAVGCDQSCTTDSNCNSGLICSSGRCRNKDCTSETDCSCPESTSTPTPTVTVTPGPTSIVTPTTAIMAEATPTPVELPQAGFTWPTFGVIFAGMAFILVASLLFLL